MYMRSHNSYWLPGQKQNYEVQGTPVDHDETVVMHLSEWGNKTDSSESFQEHSGPCSGRRSTTLQSLLLLTTIWLDWNHFEYKVYDSMLGVCQSDFNRLCCNEEKRFSGLMRQNLTTSGQKSDSLWVTQAKLRRDITSVDSPVNVSQPL